MGENTMAERIIQTADLSYIQRSLNVLSDEIDTVSANVGTVNDNIISVNEDLQELKREFNRFVQQMELHHNEEVAQTKLVEIRQAIAKKFGHYDEVRRTTTGILQASDVQLVKKDVISNVSEEIMLKTPGYWLAPCLVALSAWISDDRDLADRAIKEALKRDAEKTALLFTLICRRAGRKEASLKWASVYLSTQNESSLDRHAVIIIDAFTNGLLGRDSEGIIYNKVNEWIRKLKNTPGFEESQIAQWSDALKLYTPDKDYDYPALKKYTSDWNGLKDSLNDAYLHENILDYFTKIYATPRFLGDTVKKLDESMFSLVSNFDDDELDMKKEERLTELIIKYKGDEDKAQSMMNTENTAYNEKRNFAQLLTDAAMKNKSVNSDIATQQYAIALSKDWIESSYNDLVAKNRLKVPQNISFSVNSYSGETTDGSNEIEQIEAYKKVMHDEMNDKIEKIQPDKVGVVVGIVIMVIGALLLVPMLLIGLIAIIAGGFWAYNTNKKNKNIDQKKDDVRKQYEKAIENGQIIIRQIMAEVVDYRRELSRVDSNSSKVIEFLEQLSPEEYIRSTADTGRRVKVVD